MHNLLSDVMHTLTLKYIRKMGKRKREDDPITRKKKKENSVTIMIAVDGKRNSVLYEIKIRS